MATLKSRAKRGPSHWRKQGRKGKLGSAGAVVTKRGLVAMSGLHSALGKHIRTFGDAFEKSQRLRRRVRLIVEVNPGLGHSEITSVVEQPISDRETTSVMRDSNLQNALKAARERGETRVAEILNSEDMLSADEFADLLGTTRVTVNAKRQNRKILGLEGAKRGFRFPRWQLGPDGKPFGVLPNLFERLGDDAWAVYRFLVQHHPELNGLTGCEALQQGKSKQAVEAAESVARDFA
jgi:hypothetical protein